MDRINSSSSHTAQMKTSVPSLPVEREESVVCSLRDAGSVRERNDLVHLQATILAMRAHDVANLGSRGDQEVDSPLRQVISVRRVECHGAGVVGKPTRGVKIAV